ERLQNKKKRMPVWYWAAAACLVFALMVVAMMKNGNMQPQLPNDKIASKQPEKINKKVPINRDIATNEIKPVIAKEKTERVNKIDQKQNKIIIPAIVSKPVTNDVVTDYLKNESLANSSLISNTSLATSLKPVEKKKLNVVHINELGGPVNDLPIVSQRIDKHAFQFEIAKGEVVSDPSTTSQHTDFIISKVKTSSN
ncbi:MAG TPA: hypothetical protein VGG71_10060, partial [Chitinophagaceae bacterium]